MKAWAVIFNWHQNTPTYHAFDEARLNEQYGGNGNRRSVTRCGRTVEWWDEAEGRIRSPGDWIPRKHAEKFAVPCRSCVPREDVA